MLYHHQHCHLLRRHDGQLVPTAYLAGRLLHAVRITVVVLHTFHLA